MRDSRTANAFVRYNTTWFEITSFILGLPLVVAKIVGHLILFVHGMILKSTQTS